MHFFNISPRGAGLLLPLFLSLPFEAFSSTLGRRADNPCIDDGPGDQAPTSDGPTSNKAAGSMSWL